MIYSALALLRLKGKELDRLIRKIRMRIEIEHLQFKGSFLYSGNVHLPEIALTFDDGPDPIYTPQILDILQRHRVKASFFCTGERIVANPYIVKHAFEAGHVIANHSWSHSNLSILSASAVLSELDRTAGIIQEITGMRPLFFRPPYGSLSIQVLAQAHRIGATTILWKIDTKDWAIPGVDFIVSRALESSNGAIVLMHDGVDDGENNRWQTLSALPAIIEGLQERGYRFVTIQQMVDHLHNYRSMYMPKRYCSTEMSRS